MPQWYPRKAVTIEKGGAYVYVMRRDSTVEKRFIEVGPEFENNVVVERGVVPNENIVVEGHHKLSPGMKVRVGTVPAEHQATTKKQRFTSHSHRITKAYESKLLY